MNYYKLTEERLLELLRSELSHKIENHDKDHHHYESNVEYYNSVILDDDKVLNSAFHDKGIQNIPRNSRLLESVRDNFYSTIDRMAGNFENDKLLSGLMDMDQQEVYCMFGCNLRCIDGADHINHCVVNGIYDDAYLGVVKSGLAGWIIAPVGDEYTGTFIDTEDLQALMDIKIKTTAFNTAQRGRFNSPDWKNPEYRKAQQEGSDLYQEYKAKLETYMDPIGVAEMQKGRDEAQARADAMRDRVASRKDAKTSKVGS